MKQTIETRKLLPHLLSLDFNYMAKIVDELAWKWLGGEDKPCKRQHWSAVLERDQQLVPEARTCKNAAGRP